MIRCTLIQKANRELGREKSHYSAVHCMGKRVLGMNDIDILIYNYCKAKISQLL